MQFTCGSHLACPSRCVCPTLGLCVCVCSGVCVCKTKDLQLAHAMIKIERTHLFIDFREAFAIHFVDDLRHANHIPARVLDGHAEQRFGAITGQ